MDLRTEEMDLVPGRRATFVIRPRLDVLRNVLGSEPKPFELAGNIHAGRRFPRSRTGIKTDTSNVTRHDRSILVKVCCVFKTVRWRLDRSRVSTTLDVTGEFTKPGCVLRH